jgi:hypothetical protein
MCVYAYIMLSASMTLASAMTPLATATDQPQGKDVASVPKGYEERRICRDLSNAMIRWLCEEDVAAGAECDRLCSTLVRLDGLSVRGYFVAAQTANLRGKPDQAAAILLQLIERHPGESAQIMNLPVRVVARFWLATMKRTSGDLAGAKNTYEEVLQNLNGVQGTEGLAMWGNSGDTILIVSPS